MTKRIVLALVAFTTAVVLGAMVPLAMNATGHDRTSFYQATEDRASTFAAVVGGGESGASNRISSAAAQGQLSGDTLLVYSNFHRPDPTNPAGSAGEFLYAVPVPSGGWYAVAQQEKAQNPTETGAKPLVFQDGQWQVAVMAVYPGDRVGKPVGAVILARSTVPLETDIQTLWYILGAIALAAIVLAALLAIALARWVNLPLAALDTTARRLADGNLAIRAPVDAGPPELRRLSRTFNTMAGRLEALVHGSRAVLADVSHQLRTPLAALRLRLDLLAADAAETDPETAAELAGALEETARLSRLVDGLLAVARAENVTSQPRAIDLTEAGDERVVAWMPVAEDRGIELIAPSMAEAADGQAMGWLGEGHLEQILDNLIANALDACDAGNHVTVTATQTPHGGRVTVADDGPGMTEEERSRAFMRFTSNSPGGTGIGLAIVHRLVTSNGGTASLEATPGGGLTVVVTFPAPPKTSAAPDLLTVGNAKAAR